MATEHFAPTDAQLTLRAYLRDREVDDDTFRAFSEDLAEALAVPPRHAPRIARALEEGQRLPIIWLSSQDSGGNTEAFLRSPKITVAELILEHLSLDYHELLMAPASASAEKTCGDIMAASPNQYVVVVEGPSPWPAG